MPGRAGGRHECQRLAVPPCAGQESRSTADHKVPLDEGASGDLN